MCCSWQPPEAGNRSVRQTDSSSCSFPSLCSFICPIGAFSPAGWRRGEAARLEALWRGPARSSCSVSSPEHSRLTFFWAKKSREGSALASPPSAQPGPAVPTRLGLAGAGAGGGARLGAMGLPRGQPPSSTYPWRARFPRELGALGPARIPPPESQSPPPTNFPARLPPRSLLPARPPVAPPPRRPARAPRAGRRDEGSQGPPRAWPGVQTH